MELWVHETHSENEHFFTGSMRDITDRKAIEEEVRRLAFYDPLTELPNRRLLNDRLSQTMATGQRTGKFSALLFLDLDNFKPLNDGYGHEAGDRLLLEVAERLKSGLREQDTVARVGGDEFVVLLNELSSDRDASQAQASVVAEKIRDVVAAPYQLSIKRTGVPDELIQHRCTVSIGALLFLGQLIGRETLFQGADKAMYEAKAAGRNTVRFTWSAPA